MQEVVFKKNELPIYIPWIVYVLLQQYIHVKSIVCTLVVLFSEYFFPQKNYDL